MLKHFENQAYALLRIFSGFMFCFHGLQKVLGLFGGPLQQPLTQLWIGGILELVCGLGIFLGWRTRLWAFLASGEMAVAYFQFHWKFQMDQNFFPAVNHGELAVLYCFIFLFIATRGGGSFAVDKQAK
jgi:putative oxidoreductase